MRYLPFLLLALCATPVHAQTDLPAVADVEWRPFRAHCLELLQALDTAKGALPAETTRGIRALLAKKPRDAGAAVAAVRKLLDAHCLVGVHINPESRVKAMRGPARISLVRDQPTVVLVRVHNEGGVTHALKVTGPQLVRADKTDGERWLEAAVLGAPRLSGKRLEYRLLRLTPRQAGKREATLSFDVGQGTQDLGFRAEVPILFAVGKR